MQRSSEQCRNWMLEQATGGFMYSVSETVQKLSDCETHRQCDFIMPSPTFPYKGPKEEVNTEDFIAGIFVRFTFSLAANVMRRCLFMVSWPCGMVKLLQPDVRLETIRCFQRDLQIFKDFTADRPTTPKEKAVAKRHCMTWTSNRQYIEALAETGGVVMEESLRVASARHSGCTVTQPVEEMIGVQKNHKQLKGKKKLRTPAR